MSKIDTNVLHNGQLAVATIAQSGEVIQDGGEIDATSVIQTDNGPQKVVKVLDLNGGGGGGGTSDYSDLSNKPQINGTTLSGNKSSSDLGVADTSLSNLTDAGKIQAAHLAMPSDVYDELVVGIDGDSYTAPANGYFYLCARLGDSTVLGLKSSVGDNAVIGVWSYAPWNTAAPGIMLPCRKGGVVTIDRGALSSDTHGNSFKFVYAVGSESEKQGA